MIETNDSITKEKKKAINLLLNNGILLQPKHLDTYNNLNTKEDVMKYTKEILNISLDSECINVVDSYNENLKKREMSDFVLHYNNRFKILSKILKNRDLENLTSIDLIKGIKGKEEISTIAMINDIRESKNGHIMLNLEDKTGIIKGIVMKNNEELFEFAKDLVLDEVIAIKGTCGNEIIFISEIILPDIPINHELKHSPNEEYAVVIGDTHVGSKVFYHEEFNEFISWISGEKVPKKHKNIVSKIKYLFIAGDIIEGVGIFPGQEHEIEKSSVEEQYNLFYDYIKRIPKHIQIIICPGNHDAVRIAEPQPPFDKKYLGRLLDLPNLHLISSPGTVNIGRTSKFEGFNILMYHGFSMPYYGDKVESIRDSGGLSNTSAVMKFFLQRRHFAPAYGSTQFIPDIRSDPLVIKDIPDFLITGHVHKISVDIYKGVTMINASTWVAQSEYQSRFGLVPDCNRAVLINLKTRDVKILNFEVKKDG
jgi:DNA polymerase II small subunit